MGEVAAAGNLELLLGRPASRWQARIGAGTETARRLDLPPGGADWSHTTFAAGLVVRSLHPKWALAFDAGPVMGWATLTGSGFTTVRKPQPSQWPGPTPAARATAATEPAPRVEPAAADSPAAAEPRPNPAVSPPGSKSGEVAAKYLSEALRKLRVEHDAKTTLSLDRYGSALARNALGHEALILRVEALLALGRQGEVLRLLDGAALSDVAASHSLLVTRGELRAAAHCCADDVGDFSLVLAESGQPERQALFGRAVCRRQLGDTAGAQADLERFRREFPTDPRLGELERRLGTLP